MKARKLTRNVGIVLAAGAAGAGIALLFAPQSGARTRRLIARKAEDLGSGMRQLCAGIRDRSSDATRAVACRLKLGLSPILARQHLTR